MTHHRVDRRRFLATLGAGAAGTAVLPNLRSASAADLAHRVDVLQDASLIRLDKNENPAGPFASARAAIDKAMAEAGRYPGATNASLTEAIARKHGVPATNVVVGSGSSEILRLCTERFTSAQRALVCAHPTFEDPAFIARRLGHRVVTVPVTRSLGLDLDAMAAASRGAGLVFLCNPNNPTSTVHGAAAVRAFIARVRRESPDTMILVDEAYHEYVADSSYATMVPETRDRHVIVARTFSKVYGMAGLRVGYAVAAAETATTLAQWRLDAGVSQLSLSAAMAALDDDAALRAEQQRNASVRDTVTKWFASRGFTGPASHTNFVFVDIKRDVQPVIAASLAQGVVVGRPFPPLRTHLRLSIGTQAEMDRALAVLARALA